MSIIIETKRYAACPDCGGKVGTIDHLASDEVQRVGPWHCEDCGVSWSIRTNGRDVCDLERDDRERWAPCTVTLVLPPQKQPVFFVLHAHTHERHDEDFREGSEYFYNEHTCPTNWMRDVVEIRIGDNADPHGLFEFQKVERGHVETNIDRERRELREGTKTS